MAKGIDIMDALKQSLARTKKPPAKVKEAQAAAVAEELLPEAVGEPTRRRGRRKTSLS